MAQDPDVTLRLEFNDQTFDLQLERLQKDSQTPLDNDGNAAWAQVPWNDDDFAPTDDAVLSLLSGLKEHVPEGTAVLKFLSGPEKSASAVADILVEPPPSNNPGWYEQYALRVLKRKVALVALRQYILGRPSIWSESDQRVLLGATSLAKLPGASAKGTSQIARFYCKHSAKQLFLLTNPHLRCQPVASKTSDADVLDMLINGMFPVGLGPWRDELEYDWGRFPLTGNVSNYLPSVRVRFNGGRASPALAGISVKMERGGTQASQTWTDFVPGDTAGWAYAKHCVRVASLMAGQVWGHLGRGHVVTETYRMALDAIGDTSSPLVRLLQPFLHMVREINELGAPLIYGPTGILAASSALGAAGVRAAVGKAVAEECWEGWTRPDASEPVGTYGRAAAAYAGAIGDFVEGWFDAHDVDLAVCGAFCEALSAARQQWSAAAPASPTPETTQQLARMCTHAIFFATFFHTWVNDQQWTRGSKPHERSFGLSRGHSAQSDESYEDWLDDALPQSGDAWFQVMLADVLSHSPFGRVGAGLNQLAPPFTVDDIEVLNRFVAALREDEAALAHAGLRVDDLRVCVGI